MALTCSPLSLPKTVCWAMFFLQIGSAAVLYDLEMINDGPITTGADATIHSTLHVKHEGVSSIYGPKYQFNWIYAPLILVGKSEHGATATIVVTSPFPGSFPVSVQVSPKGCWFCRTLARNLTVLQVSEFIVGNLSVTQAEDHSITDKLGSYPAMAILIQASFFLHDPSHYFKLASFIYNWHFGDGTELTTEESSVYHNYTTSGACMVHLDVIAEWRQNGTSKIGRKTGHFTAALELLDAIRSINIIGSTKAHVMENLNFFVHIQGSPPLSLCWLIKRECIPLEGDQWCHLVVTNATGYNLNHVFSDAGQYCLSVRVENGVNALQSYREIQVRPAGVHPAFFVLPCITLLSVVLGLAVYLAFRGQAQPKDLVEVADFDFSPGSERRPSSVGWSCSQVCCHTCFLWPAQETCRTVGEHHRLLQPLRKPVKMYTA